MSQGKRRRCTSRTSSLMRCQCTTFRGPAAAGGNAWWTCHRTLEIPITCAWCWRLMRLRHPSCCCRLGWLLCLLLRVQLLRSPPDLPCLSCAKDRGSLFTIKIMSVITAMRLRVTLHHLKLEALG